MPDNDSSVVVATATVRDLQTGFTPGPDAVEASAFCSWLTSNVTVPDAATYPESTLALGSVSVFPSAPARDPTALPITYTANTILPSGITVIGGTGELTGTLSYRGLSTANARVNCSNGYLFSTTAYFTLYTPDVIDTDNASSALCLPLYAMPNTSTLRLTEYSPAVKTITNNNVAWSTASPNYYGGAASFSGAAGLVTSASADFTFGTGDFTIELWFRTSDVSAAYKLLMHGDKYVTGQVGGLAVFLYGSEIRLWKTVTVAGPTNFLNIGSFSADTWTHVAVVRQQGWTAVFLQGVLRLATADTQSYADTIEYIGRTNTGAQPLTGYMQDLRVYKALAKYPINITAPTAQFPDSVAGGDANFASVVTLLHGNGTNGSTLITDSASTIQNLPAGRFDGTGDYLNYAAQAALTLGSGNFTVETWVYFSALSAGSSIFFDGRPAAGSGVYPTLYANSTSLRWFVSAADRINASVSWNLGQWYHVAAVRSSGVTKLYVDGQAVGSTYIDANNYLTGANRPTIGGDGNNVASGANLNGYLRDFRITKGVARYTTTFVPPAIPLPTGGSDPNFASVSLLLPMSANFADSSNNNFVAIANGDAKIANNLVPYGALQISTAQSKFGGASLAFNGTNSYGTLGRTSDPLYNLGTGDFTIECWIYPTSISGTSANAAIYAAWGGGTANAYLLYIQAAGSGKITFYHQSVTNIVQSAAAPTLNAWTHVAVSRSGGTTRMYINGALQSVSSASYTLTADPAYPVTVGVYRQASAVEATSYFSGYIDDLRVTKGVARYHGNFTPPGQLLAP